MKRITSLALVLALGLATEIANADFTFGTPTNLGPTVNSGATEVNPEVSADGLVLLFNGERLGGYGQSDLWVSTRATTDDDWGAPVNVAPPVNSSHYESGPSISVDGLCLYFDGVQPGGYGDRDIWVTMQETTNYPWGEPVNLGSTINTSYYEGDPDVSADGLMLFFTSSRPGGYGDRDLWVSTRPTLSDSWGTPVNLGSTVNTSWYDGDPEVSADGLMLFFTSSRPGGYGDYDIWVTRRATIDDDWGTPVNLGRIVNSLFGDASPSLSADGRTLFFCALNRTGGFGYWDWDIWQVSIEPIVDLNGDGIVDAADACIIIDYWGTDEPLCDIGPMPWGDGIVDVQDLIVLAEHLFEGMPPVEPEEVNVDEDDDGSQVELMQGQILVVTLESNPTTGYSWEVVETQESILEQMGEAEFKPSQTGEPPLVGAGGWEIFRFKAIGAGQMTLRLAYRRPWEEGAEPIQTFSIQVVVK